MSDDRYLRHSLIDWFDQEMVAAARVIVVGAGATGNEVLKTLCLLGVGHLHIIDYDRIEPHNLTRAILFSQTDIGRYKAEVAAASCKLIDRNVNITYSTENFWKSLSIDQIRTYDALFCCVDNFEARIKLSQLCWIARTDLYNTAIDSRFVTVERYPFSTSSDCPCYECALPESVYDKRNQRYSCGWLRKRAFEEKKIPTTTITASIAGAQACSLYLHGNKAKGPVGAVRCFTDTILLNSTSSNIIRNSECPACSGLPRESQYFKVRNRKLLNILSSHELPENLTISLSDKIVLDVTCKVCGHKKSINDVVDKYDDSLLYCDTCGLISNEVVIKDVLTLSELHNTFPQSKIPVKYLSFYMDGLRFILELED